MDGVKTLKQLENMNTCDTCNKQYKHKRSLDRHMAEKHIQKEVTESQVAESQVAESQPEAEYEKSIRAFALQFLDFWGCNSEEFPVYLPESIQILIRETKVQHNRWYETFRATCIVLTKSPSSNKKELLYQLVDELFIDEIYNWGRIISLFAMAIELSEHAKRHDLMDIYYEIPDMLVYALKKADMWIGTQGGWNAFTCMFY